MLPRSLFCSFINTESWPMPSLRSPKQFSFLPSCMVSCCCIPCPGVSACTTFSTEKRCYVPHGSAISWTGCAFPWSYAQIQTFAVCCCMRSIWISCCLYQVCNIHREGRWSIHAMVTIVWAGCLLFYWDMPKAMFFTFWSCSSYKNDHVPVTMFLNESQKRCSLRASNSTCLVS